MKNIAVLYGGNSGEFDVSVGSGKVVDKYLKESGYNTYRVCIKGRDWYYADDAGQKHPIDKNDFTLSLDGNKISFDCAFNAIHGDPGENGPLEGYFQMMGIPCTSSGMTTSALTFHKNFCNRLVAGYGYVVADSMVVKKGDEYDANEVVEEIGLPCFVKPCSSGSSVGVSKVKSVEDLAAAIDHVFEIDNEAMIESFTEGREFACGIMRVNDTFTVLPLTEIITENEFFDYEAKYEGKSKEITPPENLPIEAEMQMKSISIELFDLLNCQGFVRFDYILTKEGVPVFLEVNTIPGLSEASIIPQQLTEQGIALKDFFDQIVKDTLNR